jgi:hypothetical protein
VTLNRWVGEDDGSYKLAQVFAEYPYGVTLYVPRAEQTGPAARELVRVRRARDIRGVMATRG